MPTGIDYVNEVWNVVTGCVKEFPCWKNCWARALAGGRLRGRYGYPDDKLFKPTMHWDKIEQPMGWKKPKRIFVSSMGDLFSSVSCDQGWPTNVYLTMAQCPQHTFIVLTKRAKAMAKFHERFFHETAGIEHIKRVGSIRRGPVDVVIPPRMFPNLWLGVSASTQAELDERLPELLKIPAAVRFVSLEPLIEEVTLRTQRCPECHGAGSRPEHPDVAPSGEVVCHKCGGGGGVMPDIDWIIVGCETGCNPRSMQLDWVRNLRDECGDLGVPLFFKQAYIKGYKKLVHLPLLDGVRYGEFPND